MMLNEKTAFDSNSKERIVLRVKSFILIFSIHIVEIKNIHYSIIKKKKERKKIKHQYCSFLDDSNLCNLVFNFSFSNKRCALCISLSLNAFNDFFNSIQVFA